MKSPKAAVIHFRTATGAVACAAGSKTTVNQGRASVVLGKVNCWRCLEKVLGEPPVDVR